MNGPVSVSVSVLHTQRLRLPPPALADFEHCAAFFATERTGHEGGPKDRQAAWQLRASTVALWRLNGYGAFGVDRASGAYLGELGISHGGDYPAPDLGWFGVPGAEGKGVAREAALAVLAWPKATTDWPHVTSIIEPANARSIALGLRLGGVIDATLPRIDPWDAVNRHDLMAAA